MNTPLCINRSSLPLTNEEENDDLIVLCSVTLFLRNNEDMIHYSSAIKGSLFFFFLFLSFTHFTMNHKKRTCLLSANIGTDISNYGKTDTFESIY
jgi:hypothetical protein